MNYNAFLSYSHGQDTPLSISLEKGLEKFAKPTFKRRALEIFRDGNDLSVAADLGDRIRKGLDNSEYFICMANQKYAQSKWCQREIAYWIENKPIEKFLIILTEGEILWDEATNDFDWNVTTALPKNLSGVFKGEPFFVDFRNLGGEEKLNLDNPEFENRLVVLAATLHGKSIGDMIGEEVKQHKRTMRIRNGAILIMMSLMSLTIVLTMLNLIRTKASLLHFKAKAIESSNPTLALRLEQEALKIHDYPEFERSAFSMIDKNSFYKIVASEDTASFTALDISKHQTILIASDDGSVILTDLDGTMINEFNTGKGSIRSAKFAPDGKSILTGSAKGAHLWDLEGNLKTEFKLENHEETDFSVSAVSFSPDGKTVLAGSYLGAYLWEVNGTRIPGFEITSSVKSVAFAPDGNSVLIGSDGSKGAAGLFDLNGSLKAGFSTSDPNFGEPYTITNTVAFSKDGQTVMICSSVNNIQLFDLEGIPKPDFKMDDLVNFESGDWSASFSPDGTKILISSFENTAQLIDLTGKLINEFKGHEAMINLVGFDPNDDKVIFTGSADKTIRRWYMEGLNASVFKEFNMEETPIYSIDVAPDNQSLLISSQDSSAYLWDFNGELLQEFANHKSIVNNSLFAPDGESILTQTTDGLHIWNFNGDLLQEHLLADELIESAAFTADGKSILFSAKSKTKPEDNLPWQITSVYKWDWENNSIKELKLSDKEASFVDFGSDGNTILTASKAGVILWDSEGTQIQEFKMLDEEINPVAIAPNGTAILTIPAPNKSSVFATTYGKSHLWNLEGRLIQEFKLPDESVDAIAFSDDSKYILALSYPKINPWDKGSPTARIWDLEGNVLLKLHRPGKYISSIALSPDGNYVVVGYMNSWSYFFSDNKQHKLVIYRKIDLGEFLDAYVAPLSERQKKEFDINTYFFF